MSRVVKRDFVFGSQEREQFVRLLTCCNLSNDLHLLVEVPAWPEQSLSADEVLARIELLSSSTLIPKRSRQRLEQLRPAGDSAGDW